MPDKAQAAPNSESSNILLLCKNKKLELREDVFYENDLDNTKFLNDNYSGTDIQTKAISKSQEIYKSWIGQQPNTNIVLLAGAGSSYGIGKAEVTGKTLLGLWDLLVTENNELLTKLKKLSGYTGGKDLEALLTRAYRKFELESDDSLSDAIKEVEKFITKNCSLEFSEPTTAPHSILLNKITKRKNGLPRIKVFTLNYDTLFEQAAAEQRFTIIDGFSFSSPRYFFGHSYDHDIVLRTGSRLKNEDNFVKKIFHLYKLHGSIDWIDNGKDILQYPKELIESKLSADKNLKRVLIFPRDNKFELSYEQPYFELIGRLQQALRTENTFLITTGFSFADKHIRSIIIEGLKQNSSLHLLAVTYPSIVTDKELRSFAEIDNRIMLVNDTFTEFALNFPDNMSFTTDDPLEQVVSELTKRLNLGGK